MRMFLPIKGPGGRYLTPNEKIALLVLGLTLVLGVLTLLAGEAAYLDDGAQNPIFGFVAVLCRGIGGGIIALYALVLVWSGLIYFKGERIADVAPLGGRLFAAVAVTVGVSGALGIAHLESAGELGTLVGRSLDHTLGGAVGFPVLLMLMLLGFHLAGQGAWTALREPAAAAAGGAAPSPHAAFGYGLDDPAERRFAQEPPLPDDGDPTADERSFAVKQAMEEIERSQGVTIVDVEPQTEARPTIGEDVDDAPAPAPETEEAEVQGGLQTVADALRPPPAVSNAVHREEDEDDAHGLIPVPPTEIAHEDEAYEEDEQEDEADRELASAASEDEVDGDEEEAEYEEYDDDEEEDDEEEEAEYEEYDDEEAEDDEEGDREEDDEEEEGEYEEYEEYDDDEGVDDRADEEDDEEDDEEYEEYDDDGEEDQETEDEETYEGEETAEDDETGEDEQAAEVEEAETGFARAAAAGEDAPEDEQADGFAEAESDDPYARGGLLRRMQRRQRQVPEEDRADDDRVYTTFDWRGRPLD